MFPELSSNPIHMYQTGDAAEPAGRLHGAATDPAGRSRDSSQIALAYVLNGGSNSTQNPTQVSYRNLPLVLDVPVREGYNFAGWYEDFRFQKKITKITHKNAKNTLLFAKWTKEIDSDGSVKTYPYASEQRSDQTSKALKECTYRFLEHIEIPGMPSTREKDVVQQLIEHSAQCIQGICLTPDFLLITSYAEHADAHGSLMVFDRKKGTYHMTLKMKKESHLGGIAYDGQNIWICHSNSKTLERLPYQKLLQAARKAYGKCVDLSFASEEYHVPNIPSCITCHNGKLWVATHTKVFDSNMYSYHYDGRKNELLPVGQYRIPPKVQGIAFGQNNAVYLSISYGRNNSSYLNGYASLSAMNQFPGNPAVKVEMPPCAEQIAAAEGNIYVIFESASQKYFEGTDGKGESTAPIDKVLEIKAESIWET